MGIEVLSETPFAAAFGGGLGIASGSGSCDGDGEIRRRLSGGVLTIDGNEGGIAQTNSNCGNNDMHVLFL